jgi:dienelactone hydrolase
MSALWRYQTVRRAASCFLVALLPSLCIAQQTTAAAPQTVEIPSGSLVLKGLLWTPPGFGPFPAVLFNHGRSDTPQQYSRTLTVIAAANALGPVFAAHGYVFLFPFRRGEGLSADQGEFIGDVLQAEENAHGVDARIHLQTILLSGEHLQDGLASLAFLKTLRQVDKHRIAVGGHSFGGQLALLETEKDPSIRGALTFGAAAASWSRSKEIRSQMIAAVDRITVPVLLIHAANDYSLDPGYEMAAEFRRLSKPCVLKIYPAAGRSTSDGHNFLFADVPAWEKDVFDFLDENVGR